MNHILRSICDMMRADLGWIALAERDTRNIDGSEPRLRLIPQATHGAWNIRALNEDQGVTGYCFRHGIASLVEDTHSRPEYVECVSGIRSELCCPLILYGKPIGVINLESKKPGRFTIENATELKEFAGQIVRGLACSAILSGDKFREVGKRLLSKLEYKKDWKDLADLVLEQLHIELKGSEYKFVFLVFMYENMHQEMYEEFVTGLERAGLYCIAHKEPKVCSEYDLERVATQYSEKHLLQTRSMTGEALLSNREVYVSDMAEMTKEGRLAIAEELKDILSIMKSMLVIPLPSMGNTRRSSGAMTPVGNLGPKGTLNIISVDRHTDFMEYKTMFRMYSELLSFVYLCAKMHRKEETLDNVRRLVGKNLGELFLDMLHREIIHEIVDSLGACKGSIFYRYPEDDVIRCVASTGLYMHDGSDRESFYTDRKALMKAVYSSKPEQRGISYTVYESKLPVRFFKGDSESMGNGLKEGESLIREALGVVSEPLYWELPQRYAESFLAVPIVIGDDCLGVIRLVNKDKNRGVIFTEDDEDLLLEIADILAPAMRMSSSIEQ